MAHDKNNDNASFALDLEDETTAHNPHDSWMRSLEKLLLLYSLNIRPQYVFLEWVYRIFIFCGVVF